MQINQSERNFAAVEEKAWVALMASNPSDVCRRTLASFDKAVDEYIVNSYGVDFAVSITERKISCNASFGDYLVDVAGYFFRSSLLWYLIHAKESCLSGKLVKPENLKGGQLFASGTHVLPLCKLASKFASDKTGFLKRGLELGGAPASYGDAALQIKPFPRLPMTVILWLEDEEFPARAELLVDASCSLHLPIDILWSIAMITVAALLDDFGLLQLASVD